MTSIFTAFEILRSKKRRHVERERRDMHNYQHMAVEFAKRNPFCALFIDLGLGKTIISLTTAADLLIDGAAEKVLVIAPLKVAKQTWPTEIKLWGHTCFLRHSLITGDTKDRLRAIKSDAPIHVVNRENVQWLVDHYKRDWPYDMVIIDESSAFKDHKTQRFKALKNVRPYIKRMMQLTASPVAESYEHLFAQIYLLDQGERFGKFITHYLNNYFSYNKYSMKHKVIPGKDDEIVQKISDITLEMRAQDYLPDLKGYQVIERSVTLDDDQLELYRRMSKDFMIEIFNEVGEGKVIEAETAAVLAAKLLQMASGVIYEGRKVLVPGTDKVKREVTHHYLHDHKLQALDTLAEELEGENLIVCYWFKSSLNRLKEKFPKAVVLDREGSQVDAWNKGKIKMLFLHPQSGGHGLNLQKGGRNIVFFDLPASYELWHQVIGRLARQGQKHLVRIWVLLARKTDDEKALQRLKDKQDAQDYFYQKLKRYHAKVKKLLMSKIQEL